jgi:hypothetical protein
MRNVDRIGSALGKALGPADPKLAASVKQRLSEHDVPGSRWAHSGGCAMTFEHPDKVDAERGQVMCGMGYVPEKSRRFLYLLATKPAP